MANLNGGYSSVGEMTLAAAKTECAMFFTATLGGLLCRFIEKEASLRGGKSTVSLELADTDASSALGSGSTRPLVRKARQTLAVSVAANVFTLTGRAERNGPSEIFRLNMV